MVIQRGWRGASTEMSTGVTGTTGGVTVNPGQTSSSDDSNGSWATPARAPAARPVATTNAAAVVAAAVSRQPITRQVAINTLAAMHRRFSLPGPVQPHSRPVAEFRASANKSLDMLRQTIQSAVSREIDQVIKKYLEKFFVPAVNNIRLNLGEESVSEDQVRAVCRAMLDATRALYAAPSRPTASPAESDSDSCETPETRLNRQQTLPINKRKESEIEDTSGRRKRVKQEDIAEVLASPHPPSALRDPSQWDPARLTPETLFIMGSHAHKVLGLGNSRGRLYTKHADLFRYPADTTDKEWIATHNLMNAVGGKTYIMVLEDIEELAATDHYRNNALPMLGELTGFKAPPFMLKKMKDFLVKRLQADSIASPHATTSVISQDIVKIEVPDDMDDNNPDDFPDLLPVKEEDQDFDLIKVDVIKVEDIEDLKVDGIKVEDIDVDDIKVENIDDISVDGIKVEDIKLEPGDFNMCKGSDDDQSHLVDGLLEADIEFLSRNLGNIESEADARKTIEKLTGANPDTLTLMGDEFDFGTTLNTSYPDTPMTKCITVASTTSGMVHSVPVAHLTTSSRLAGHTAHYTAQAAATPASTATVSAGRATIHHLPQATVTIHSVPGTTAQIIRGLPISTKTGTFSTVMSTGTANIVGVNTHYVNVTPKSFPTGNILHNAIVSRNMIRNTSRQFTTNSDFDTISTTKDMIDNACNSSVMLKKVLTLGSSTTKSFMMQNTQKILSTGFATGSGPAPNVVVNSGGSLTSSASTLSATYATLSALLAASTDATQPPKSNN